MKYLPKLRALMEFLRSGRPSLDDVMQFVALNTLNEFRVITIFLATVKNNGYVKIISKFGCTEDGFQKIPDRLVSVDVPVNKSLRTSTIVECGNSDEYLFAGPGYRESLFPNGFAYSLAWPIPTIGSAVIYCAQPATLDVQMEEFLLAVGGILCMELHGVRQIDVAPTNEDVKSSMKYALTARQWQIYEGILLGLTNIQIASNLDLNELLVRRDVSVILSKLGVSDREELRTIEISPASISTQP